MNLHQNPIGYVVICGVVILIIALNISLITALKNRSTRKPMEMYKSAFDRAKSPWQPEDDALNELSEMVDKIKPDKNEKNNNK
jgi:hypothetical protein